MKYDTGSGKRKNDPETRTMLSFRFRAMYRNLGLSRLDAAQLLHVSERTLHNWESGHHEIPYSAYKLMRLLNHEELPGQAWAGWHITAGVLWSPEGHGFKPLDSSWWGLLCRRAALFHPLYQDNVQLRISLMAVRHPPEVKAASRAKPLLSGPLAAVAPTGAAGWAAKPTGLDLTSKHFSTPLAKLSKRSLTSESGVHHD